MEDYERDEDGNLPFEAMDKGDGVDEMWFSGDKPTKAGQEFLDRMANFSAPTKFMTTSLMIARASSRSRVE